MFNRSLTYRLFLINLIFFIFSFVMFEVLNMFNIETESGCCSAKSALLSAAK